MPAELINLLHDLISSPDALQASVPAAGLPPLLALLRSWQSSRLARTYADLLEDPRYSPVCRFFLSDIYAPRDFSQRDHDAERLYAILARYLPAAMLRLLADVLRLNQLTNALDLALLRILVDELRVTDAISPQQYAQAYRLCANYPARKEQIDLLVQVLAEAGEGAHHPLVGISLRLARRPALRLGWFELVDFLERGYAAARSARHFDFFVKTIQNREMHILDRIFSNHPDPFNLTS